MDQPPAFLAFAVKADLSIFMALRLYVFEAGGAVPVNVVLFDDALIDQTFQVPIDR